MVVSCYIAVKYNARPVDYLTVVAVCPLFNPLIPSFLNILTVASIEPE